MFFKQDEKMLDEVYKEVGFRMNMRKQEFFDLFLDNIKTKHDFITLNTDKNQFTINMKKTTEDEYYREKAAAYRSKK